MNEAGDFQPETQRPAPKRLVKIIAGIVAWLVLLTALAVGLSRTSIFAVKTIDVSGADGLVSADDVKQAAAIRVGSPLISVEENAVRSRIQALPGIESANVESHWPDQVQISVKERTLAMVAPADGNRWAVVSADGVVVEVNDQPLANLPAMVGVTVAPSPGQRIDGSADSLLRVATMIPDSLKSEVVQIQDDRDNGIRLGLRSGVIVDVGSDEQLGDKLTAAAAVLRQVNQSTISSLDVRSPSLPVTNPKESSKPNPQPTPSTTTTTSTPQRAR